MHFFTALPALLATGLLALPVAGQDVASPADHHRVIVRIPDAAAATQLLALGLDLAACHPLRGAKEIVVIATSTEIEILQRAGLDVTVAQHHLEDHHARELAAHGPFPDEAAPPLGQGEMGGHYTLSQVLAVLDELAAAHPTRCAPRVSIGQSAEGREIWMVKISDNVSIDEPEPEVLYDALHHAREPMSMQATLHFMRDLLENHGTDPEATFLIDERELYFVPVVNPDGYEYNRRTRPGGGGLWRKNRRDLGNGIYGVDLNRNYRAGFGTGGASGNPLSDVYRGPFALSEPETRALDAFAASRQFMQVFSSHSYTDVLLRPWGHRTGDPANAADYERIGDVATADNGIAHGSALSLLYQASGTALDHHHEIHGSLAWTPEIGRLSEGGFWPPAPNIVTIANRHLPMFRAIARLAGPALRDGELILMSNGTLGTTGRIGLLGTPGGLSVLLAGPARASVPIPGILGNFRLEPGLAIAFPAREFGSSGYLVTDFAIPNDPRLTGSSIYWQAFHTHAGAVPILGNLAELRLN